VTGTRGSLDELRTERLLLRRWRAADRGPFAALNADPVVAEHLPGLLTPAESDALLERLEAGFTANGFGLWAVQAPEGLVGFTGLEPVPFPAPFAPAVEVGWRLARPAWGRGYATEAATATLDAAFGRLGLAEVVSFTVPANTRSRAVMERLGMVHDRAGDFDHPALPAGSRLRRHVLYRTTAERWARRSRRHHSDRPAT
jgi:RimJ/RimL family protein N-acetyltransferase